MPHMTLRPSQGGLAVTVARWTQSRVYVRIAGDASRPCALGLDVTPRLREQPRPLVASAEDGFDGTRECAGIACRKQKAGFAIANELAVASYIGRDEHASLRHRFEGLQRR